SLVDSGEDTDALVVIVVPDRVDLGVGGEQLLGDRLATRDGEVRCDAGAHLETTGRESVVEAAGAVLGEGQGVDAGDLRDHGVGPAADLATAVLTSGDTHAVVVAEHRRAGRV